MLVFVFLICGAGGLLGVLFVAAVVVLASSIFSAPLGNGALKVAAFLAAMHHGRINAFAAYGLIALIFALVRTLSLSAPT